MEHKIETAARLFIGIGLLLVIIGTMVAAPFSFYPNIFGTMYGVPLIADTGILLSFLLSFGIVADIILFAVCFVFIAIIFVCIVRWVITGEWSSDFY